MGSITKRPKTPTVTYVKQTVPTSVVASTSETTAAPTQTETEISTESRTDSLLRRSRGRFGTIATSFRGLLSSADNNENQPKTLLGE